MSKSLYSVEQRLTLINDCYTSGLSVYAWCKEKQIAPGTFYSWIHYLKKQGCTLPEAVPANLREKPVRENHEIVKVNIVEETIFTRPEMQDSIKKRKIFPTTASPLSVFRLLMLLWRLQNP